MEERTEITAWMSDLAVLARESANALRRVAEVVEDSTITESLNRLAESREAVIDELDQAIWDRDALTRTPNADLEGLRDLKTHFEAFVHLREPPDLLRRCQETEAKLFAAAEEVTWIKDLPADFADIAARLKQGADEGSSEIARLLHRV